jgi:hypothetical protein
MTFTVYVSDSKKFKEQMIPDQNAILCTNENIKEILSKKITVYTSVEDLNISNFIDLLLLSDEIIYLKSDSYNKHTQIYLNFINKIKPIKNFQTKNSDHNFLRLQDYRKSENSQIWVIGCSFADGKGVDQSQKFGQIIADNLNLPVSFLTLCGSSIEWAADQIIRSDIRTNDIVIWALTGISRFSFFDDNNNINLVTESNWDSVPILSEFINKKYIISQNIFCKSVLHISQVQNHLDKIGCKYVFGMLPINIKDLEDQILDFVSSLKNSLLLYKDHFFLDYGTDKVHPGPKQHRLYADQILHFLKK